MELNSTVPAPGSTITGLGCFQPSMIVTNAEVAARIGVTDEWIRGRTGITQRHRAAPDESVVDMAAAAALKALAGAGVPAQEVDLVLLATCSMPSPMPNGAASIASQLGIAAPAALDVNAACAGFCHALALADGMIRAGISRTALVIGAERMLDWTDPTDRMTAALFGDAAGAAVVQASAAPGIGPVAWGSDGQQADLIRIPEAAHAMSMQGTAVYRWATSVLEAVARTACAKAGVAVEQLKGFVPHQANMRITDAVAAALGIAGIAIGRDIADSGNTSAASVPMALSRLVERQELSHGDPVLLLGFGAGLTYAAQVVHCP